jgi:putative transposase
VSQKAYRYRCYPTSEQAQNLACTFGCCRFIYNWGLKLRTTSYFQHGVRLSHNDLSAAMTALKKQEGTAWLKEVSSVPLQQALRHLDRAFTNFFEKRNAYPSYKKKHGRQSATFAASAFVWDGTSLTLAKQASPLLIVWSRPLPVGCQPSSVTISKDKSGRYFVSILIEEEIATLPMTDKTVGIDLGLKSLLITSEGETVVNPKYYTRDERKLAKAQRRLAKKRKGSKNRDKARQKVARLHARIADSRRDFQHKATTKLIRENQVICLESLAVKNMLKNHKLAKAIADVGWSELVRQLEYKAAWYGRTIVKIDRWYPSSKTCSVCQHVREALTLDIRSWTCPNCGTCHERDINAAKNILAAGLVASDCGGIVRHGRVQAPHAGSNEAVHSPS